MNWMNLTFDNIVFIFALIQVEIYCDKDLLYYFKIFL